MWYRGSQHKNNNTFGTGAMLGVGSNSIYCSMVHCTLVQVG